VLGDVPETFTAMQWHHYACELPPGAVELGRNPTCLQAFRLGESAWGTQFHIEVTRDILMNWLRWGKPELEQAGYTEERYLAELDRNLEAHEAIGRGMAERFAAIAAARARSAA
jgi:GMP synthase (glutamine-hydrolysing)